MTPYTKCEVDERLQMSVAMKERATLPALCIHVARKTLHGQYSGL